MGIDGEGKSHFHLAAGHNVTPFFLLAAVSRVVTFAVSLINAACILTKTPVKPDDLAATMYHLLGIRHDTEIFDTQDRPLPIAAGEPIADIIS